MEKKYILVVDEGTTGVRTFLYDRDFNVICSDYLNIELIYPHEFECEVDADDLYNKTVQTMKNAVKKAEIDPGEIAAVGIAAQRSTWMYWDKVTGEPYRNGIVWVDTRAMHLREKYAPDKQLMARFPWLYNSLVFQDIDNRLAFEYTCSREPEFAAKAASPNAAAGTVDTWLVYKLTKERNHFSAIGYASTNCSWNATNLDWDWETYDYFGMNRSMFAELKPDCSNFGTLREDILGVEIPILACMADQAASLFGEGCVHERMAKSTLGTGFYLVSNIGGHYSYHPGFLCGIGWQIGEEKSFFLEGYGGAIGTTMEWAKKQLRLFDTYDELDDMLNSVPDTDGISFVPTLQPVSCRPYKDATLQGSFMGLQASSNRAHMVRAICEGMMYSAAYMMDDYIEVTGLFDTVRINGGLSRNDFMVQMLADLEGMPFLRGTDAETTSRGAAQMAALNLGWVTLKDIEKNFYATDRIFTPRTDERADYFHEGYRWWKKALKRSHHWKNDWDLEKF